MPNWKKLIVSGSDATLNSLNVNNSITGATLQLSSIDNAGTDTDKFLVLDSNGNVDFRTGTEVRSDIGADSSMTDDEVQDIVVGMISGNTESGITVTAGASNAKLDFTVASQTDNNFTNTLKTKLDNIEALADVTDTTNVVNSLTAGTNVTIDTDGTISSTDTNTQLSTADVRSKFTAGTNVSIANGVISSTDTNTQLSTEQVEDIVGGMVTGNTESGITVTYQDTDGTLDFSVASQTDNNFTNTLKTKLDNIAENANNYSLPLGTSTVRGGFKLGFTESGKNYPVEQSGEKLYVNVPWTDTNTDTTYSTATSSTLGLVKIGYTENGKNYPVELSSGKMYVNVPWTDTNTDTNTQLSDDEVQDIVIGMISGNTESGITVTAGDSNAKLDFTVASQTDNNFTNALKSKLDGIASSANYITNNTQISNGRGYITGFDITTQTDSKYLRSDTSDTMTGDLTLDSSGQGWIKGYDQYHSIKFRAGGGNKTEYYEYGGTLAAGLGHKFFTGGTTSQTLKFQVADDGSYFSGNVGIGTTTPSSKLEVYGSGGTVLDIQGSQGQLFSVTDDLTGTLFTVSDISGIPIFEVDASGESSFDGDVTIDGKLSITTRDTNTSSTTALVMNGNEVEQRTLGSNAFNSTTINTYYADGNYGMTLSGTTFRLEDDRRRNSSTTDIYTGNTHDFTFYDASVGIRWYTAGSEDMRLYDNGTLHVDGDIIAYSTTISDARLKDDVVTIENAIDKIKKLRGVEYTWNAGTRKDKRDLGLIAQEVEEVLPEIVHEHDMPLMDGAEDNTTYKTVDYEKIVGVLIEGMKELSAKVEELENKLK